MRRWPAVALPRKTVMRYQENLDQMIFEAVGAAGAAGVEEVAGEVAVADSTMITSVVVMVVAWANRHPHTTAMGLRSPSRRKLPLLQMNSQLCQCRRS